MMEGGLISLGFVVVTPFVHKGWEDKSVPPIFYTPSSCLCDLYPDPDLLGWWGKDVSLSSQYVALGLTLEQGAELSEWLQELFNTYRWGFDCVFVHLEDAQAFVRRWGGGLADLKILETALPANWAEEFLAAQIHTNSKAIPPGRHFAARLGRSPLPGQELGFEVLGVSQWSDDHTSACSDVRLDFWQGFGAQFNTHGFLTTLEQAELAAREYMFESDGSGIEDCYWFPIQISEVPLTALPAAQH